LLALRRDCRRRSTFEARAIDPDESRSRRGAIGTVTPGCAGRRTGFLDGRVEVAARAPITRAAFAEL